MNQILLSVCIAGKNDSKDSLYLTRLKRCIQSWQRSIENVMPLDAEIVLLDYGSERVPCGTTGDLLPALGLDTYRFIRHLYVPKEVAGPKFVFPVAYNAAMKRARGTWVLQCDSDTVVPPSSMVMLDNWLRNAPNSEVFMEINRAKFPENVWQKVEKDADLFRTGFTPSPIKVGPQFLGNSSGVLVSRQLFCAATGFDETLSGWGWTDIDFHKRMITRAAPLPGVSVGVWFGHLEHPAKYNEVNPHGCVKPFVANDPLNWGLGLTQIENVAVNK